MPNSKQVGDISEAKIVAQLLELGFSVSTPFGDNQRYDLIVDTKSELLRVQVKTARLNYEGLIVIPVASLNYARERKGYKEDVEAIAAYCPSNLEIYWLPIEMCGTSEVKLRTLPPNRQKNSARTNWADSFLIHVQLKEYITLVSSGGRAPC